MSRGPLWLAQQLIPPLLLSYFYYAWKVCTFEVGPDLIYRQLGHPVLAWVYSILPSLFISPITFLYLRLYLLPSSQSVPPFDPPITVTDDQAVYQCISPAQAKAIRLADVNIRNGTDANANNQSQTRRRGLQGILNEDDESIPEVERCYKGRCGGRWKPARARHCSQCGVCRGGFDHHCPFFANCLTAAHMRTFLALLLYTPPAIIILSSPLYMPLFHRARLAYTTSWADERIRSWWWDWTWSWVVAGGPVGRYAGGVILGWRELDRIDTAREGGAGVMRLNVGLMLVFGIILAMISAGLAFSTVTVLLSGHLTIDKGRSSAHGQAVSAIYALKIKGLPIPDELEAKVWRFSDKRWFFVPLPPSLGGSNDTRYDDRLGVTGSSLASNSSPNTEGQPINDEEDQGVLVQGGAIIPTLRDERPYDHGPKKNMQIILGTNRSLSSWSWLLPWNALRTGISRDEMFLWPLAPDVETRLRIQAERLRLANKRNI
ncbi:hypothetical protein IAU59_007494 [Kwoniella sp. CBS 9459]